MHGSFQIGDWLVEPELNRITRKDRMQAIEPRLMRLLMLLAATPKQLVSKDDILSTVWDGLSVTDESLSQAISKLRKLLDDSPDGPAYIETIRKKGYRLVADVTPADTSQTAAPTSQPRARMAVAALTAAAVIIAITTYAGRNTPDERPVQFLVSQPLSNAPGRERDPSISGDGNFVVYSKHADGEGGQIFLHGIGRGTDDRQLTNQADNKGPAVMPGSTAVVFLRSRPGGCTVIITSLIDGAERIAGDCTGNSYADTTVSPDGNQIAFGAKNIPPEGTAGEEHAIVILNVRTGERRPVTTPPDGIWGDYDPVFAPDGNSLYFVRSVSEAMQDVYKVNLSDGTESRLTHDGQNIMGITVVGSQILFASNRDGRYGIWSIGNHGKGLTRLPVSQTGIVNPSASHNGSRLVFETIERVVALGAISPQASDTNHLLQFNAEILHPDPDPTFSRMAFSSNRSGFFEIWAADTDGRNLARLTDFRAGFTAHPRFSPNGQRIAFDARPAGKARIFIMDADGKGLKAVSPDDNLNRYAPTWTTDGNSLLYARETDGRLELWQLNLDVGSETRLTESGGTFGYLAFDGSLYHTRPNQPGIWRLSPDMDEPGLILGSLQFSDWGNWITDGRTIRFFDRPSGTLKVFDIKSGMLAEIARIDGFVPTADPAIGFSHSAESLLVVTRLRLESDMEYVEMGPPASR